MRFSTLKGLGALMLGAAGPALPINRSGRTEFPNGAGR